MTSELQGNVVDLCPVGALTSKPYAFAARPWELNKTAVDRRDGRARLGDPHRHARTRGDAHPAAHQRRRERGVDFRQDAPRGRRPAHAAARPALHPRATAGCGRRRWTEAFAAIAAKVKAAQPERIGAIAGDLAARRGDVRAQGADERGSASANIDCRQDGAALDPAWGRASYLFNATIAGIEQADALLIIGANPRREAPVLNARIRKRWRTGNLPIGVIGEKADLTYRLRLSRRRAGDARRIRRATASREARKRRTTAVLDRRRARSRGRTAPRSLALAAKAAVDVGASRTAGTASRVLHTAASRVGALDLGFVPGAGRHERGARWPTAGALDVLFLLGADEIDIAPGAFVVYIGTHGDRGAHRADVILPGAAYTEKSGTLRQHRRPRADGGRAPPSRPATRARTGRSCARCPTCSARSCLTTRSRSCARRCSRRIRIWRASTRSRRAMPPTSRSSPRSAATPTRRRSARRVADFYLTNPIARASAVMAECSALARGRQRMTAAE